MGKIRNKDQKNKIDGKSSKPQGCSSEQYVWYSFRSLTTNSAYNLDSLPPGSERAAVLEGLFSKLKELSTQPWTYWMQKPKSIGLETMAYHEIKFSANPTIVLAKDTTIYIFRFDTHNGKGQGRILGYKSSPCAVLHIIGFDIDFSSYNHGS